jgi:hypothetical protein
MEIILGMIDYGLKDMLLIIIIHANNVIPIFQIVIQR